MDDLDYVCSGSVVAADNDSTVLTAGHCIHAGSGGDDGFATNVAFVPAYSGNGSNQVGQFGVWVAEELVTTSQWATSSSFDYDVGFIEVVPNDGKTIFEAVGGAQGIAFNQSRGVHVYAFGYPAAPPYAGDTLTYCAGELRHDRPRSTQGLECDMTGGSSGGPHYVDFDEAEGTGTAYSVNSYVYLRGGKAGNLYGPYFGSVIEELYLSVQG